AGTECQVVDGAEDPPKGPVVECLADGEIKRNAMAEGLDFVEGERQGDQDDRRNPRLAKPATTRWAGHKYGKNRQRQRHGEQAGTADDEPILPDVINPVSLGRDY